MKLQAQTKKQSDNITRLQVDSLNFAKNIAELNDQTTALGKEIEDLRTQKERLISQKDSVERLLAYSRANERNSQAKINQLQKQLKDLQTKLNVIQQKYDELLANSDNFGSNARQQVEALTAERNALAEENQRLQRELIAATGNADNRTAIFTTKMNVNPGEVKRNKFSTSTRSQNTDRLEVTFTLSRPPKPTENLIFKVFDSANKEILIKPKYRNELNAPANPTNLKVMLEFEGGYLDRRASGIYSVRLYLTDINKGLENQEIGIRQFELK